MSPKSEPFAEPYPKKVRINSMPVTTTKPFNGMIGSKSISCYQRKRRKKFGMSSTKLAKHISMSLLKNLSSISNGNFSMDGVIFEKVLNGMSFERTI